MYCEVVFPISLNKSFTYLTGHHSLKSGMRVLVPFGKGKKVGFVSEVHARKPHFPLKEISNPLPSLFSHTFWRWLTWASDYYLTPLGEVLGTALPKAAFDIRPTSKKPKPRKEALEGHWMQEGEIRLTPGQTAVLGELNRKLLEKKFGSFLLQGVTGSGKTEVYLRFMEEVVKTDRQVIYLVPEIGLTPQAVGRLAHYFEGKLALYHSGLTEAQRLKTWQMARDGEISVIVGTRSALFAPFEKLGAIIVDEEHDGSFKQEEGFRYHARDMALVRGKLEEAVVVMGSATPSIESLVNVKTAKHALLSLPDRIGESVLPKTTLIDMAKEKRQSENPYSISRPLMDAIGENLKKKEQTILLINRRGFATAFFCLSCKKGLNCLHCDVTLPYHKKEKTLLCHYCDTRYPLPKVCPTCHGSEVTLIGTGSETIEEEIKTFFPWARVARLDRDSTRKKGSLIQTLKAFRDGDIDILVGTQMLAKGHDVAGVTLVGIIGFDTALTLPDFRATERAFQLLVQVGGRAGRGAKRGQVFVQTFEPNHTLFRFAGTADISGFLDTEIPWREALLYPPFGRLVQFRFLTQDEKAFEKLGTLLEKPFQVLAGKWPQVSLLGPAPAPLHRLKAQFRWHLLLKSKAIKPLHEAARYLREVLEKEAPKGLKWSIDVDPVGML